MPITPLKSLAAAVVAGLTCFLGAPMAEAQECKPDAVFALIDETGARLRDLNDEAQPRIRAKLRDLARVRGWSDAELEMKGRQAVDLPAIRAFDQVAARLLAEISQLAENVPSDPAGVCERLTQARAKSGELVGVTAARTEHAIAQIDAAIAAPAPAATEPSGSPTSATQPAPAASAPPSANPSGNPPPQPAAPREPPARQAAAAPKAKTPPPSWEAQRIKEIETSAAAPPPPPPEMPIPVDPGALGFSPEEIRAAGRGLFGNISAGLASVIDYAFQNYGKPTGYVLGDEGGAAFFAGLRYGEGRLVTKSSGERRVYWQGPSAGFDWGVTGSRVMFLVYSIDDHQEMFQRFTGVDGSAYLVGGVGITFLKRGKIILAPIRTGLGLRVGANIGYLKFTPSPSLNPF